MFAPALLAVATHTVKGDPDPSPPATQNVLGAVSCTLVGAVLCAALAVAFRARFRAAYQSQPNFRHFATWAEKVVIFVCGTVIASVDLFKAATVAGDHSNAQLFGYGMAGAGAALGIALTWLLFAAKEGEKDAVADVTGQLASALEKLATMEGQRNVALEVISVINAAVTAKKKRLTDLAKRPSKVKPVEMGDAFGPRVQIFTLIHQLHDYLHRHLDHGKTLRVGIYMRDPATRDKLTPLYSWDGQSENCFSKKHPESMIIEGSGTARSLVVQCYRAEKFLMVADCTEAAKKDEFVFFSDTQREKIRSMAAYCYVLKNEGKREAVILAVDTNQPGFFASGREFQCKLVMDEICNRFELELHSLNLLSKLKKS